MENKKKWRSPSLGMDMQISIHGRSGTPILAFPAYGDSCEQWKKKNMIKSVSFQLENKFNQFFCVESPGSEPLLDRDIKPQKRITRLEQYQSYIIEEVVPFIQTENPNDFLMVAGIGTGGYHALNLALKFPNVFDKVVGISGLYDIRPLMDNFYDDSIYYNNPIDFLPNINNNQVLAALRGIDFRLVAYANDAHKSDAYRMSEVMTLKFIDHRLDIWDLHANDPWELWPRMMKTHII